MSVEKKILIVDDHKRRRCLLAEQLRLCAGYVVDEAETAKQALAAAENSYFDSVILDVELSDVDGIALCRLMRRRGVKSPIIMLSERNIEADQILSFEASANDYVIRPFRLNVLLARLRAIMRQYERSEDAVFAIGSYRFQPARRLLVDCNEQKIPLTGKETAILKILCLAGPVPVSRDTLLSEVWGQAANVTSHTLETHIHRMRKKMEANPSKVTMLVKERRGYRLVR